jgi:hypothetical protein
MVIITVLPEESVRLTRLHGPPQQSSSSSATLPTHLPSSSYILAYSHACIVLRSSERRQRWPRHRARNRQRRPSRPSRTSLPSRRTTARPSYTASSHFRSPMSSSPSTSSGCSSPTQPWMRSASPGTQIGARFLAAHLSTFVDLTRAPLSRQTPPRPS